MKLACQLAHKAGVNVRWVKWVETKREVFEALCNAEDNPTVAELRAACSKASRDELYPGKVDRLQKLADRLAAEDLLVDAEKSADIKSMGLACERARRHGVDQRWISWVEDKLQCLGSLRAADWITET